MAYAVYVEPRNRQAGIILGQNFEAIDERFKSIHDQNFFGYGRRCDHGLELSENGRSVYAYAHWDFNHLMETKSNLIRAMEEVLGTAKQYTIKASAGLLGDF